MRIKTWLLLSYLIVMILPLAAAYLLFSWITVYNDDEKVEENLQVSSELASIKTTLDDPALFQQGANMDQVETLANDQRSIVLYNKDGLVIYTSNPGLVSPHFGLGDKQMYENLYEIEQGYHSYTYKQPVLENNDMVGFYYIQLARDEWVKGVSFRTTFISGLFILFFILIYIIVIRLVNRKLNVRFSRLMKEMSAFARGKTVEEKETNNDEIGELTKHFYQM